MNNFDITPNASKTIESLRHLTYTNVSALADIVDNSLDANASTVQIAVSDEESHVITIIDDGFGMDFSTMQEAIKLGSNTDKGESDLGRFGMGLVTASISMARRLEVVSMVEFGEPHKIILDLDYIRDNGVWSATEEELNTSEKALFKTIDHGTMVILKKVDSKEYARSSTLVTHLKQDFSEIFRKYISANTKIFVNGDALTSTDPLELANDMTEILFEDDINFKDGVLSVKFVMLENVGADTAKERGYSISNQGVYVVRNMRQIARGQTLGLFTRHNDFNRMRIEVSYTSNLDDYFGINFTKNEVLPTQALVDKLRENLQSFIALTRNRAKKNQAVDKSKEIDHSEAAEVITRKSKLLITKHLLKEKRNSSTRSGEPSHRKEVEGTKNREHIRKFQQGDRSVSVKFGEIDLGTTGDLYQIDFEGTMTVINWNISHPFHAEVVSKYSGDKDISLPLDFFVFSLATAELSIANDDNRVLLEQIRSTLSSNLRVLMQ